MSMSMEISEIEAVLAQHGYTTKALCDAAEINQSTWTRWKSGDHEPNLATWRRVQAALRGLTLQTEAGAA